MAQSRAKYELANSKDLKIDYSLYPPFIKQLDVKLPEYEREGNIEYPFEETKGVGDENRIRGNWNNKNEFLLSAIGFTFGVGNLWRFPVLIFEHGGAAFLIPYFIVLVLAAFPMLFMEAVLGQFSSSSAIAVWKVVPLFKGLGIGMIIICSVIAIYLNVVSSWSLFYLVNSIGFSLPWSNCENSWNGQNCTLGTRLSCLAQNGTLFVNGSCSVTQGNSSSVINLPDQATIPSLRYFHQEVLMLSSGFEDIGNLNWYLGICVLISWITVFLSLFQGVKSSGKVVYVVVVVPFIIMAALLVRLLTLDGATTGLIHFFTPNWNVLMDFKVWGAAAVHAVYSVSCCTGGIMTLASYNRFHNDIFKNIVYILLSDVAASLICCVLTFAAIGFMGYEFNIALNKFHIGDGVHLVFIFLAEALAAVPVAPLYTALFFLMLLLIIYSTQLFVIETIVSSLCDEFPERLRKNRRHVLTSVCSVFVLLSLPFCLSAGLYWLLLLSKFTITWPLVAIAFLECMAINWCYGVDNLLDNIKWISGSYPPLYVFWKILWKFICPVVYLFILCFLWSEWQNVVYENYVFPYWTILLGWAISAIPLLCVPVTAIVMLANAKGNLVQKWSSVINPDDAWGPALAVHRAEHFPLQIPEARRQLISPELGMATTPLMQGEDEDEGSISESGVGDPKSTRVTATTRSGGATVHTQPAAERETAI